MLATGHRPGSTPHSASFVPFDYLVESIPMVPHLFRARLVGYRYAVIGAEQRELLAYHWHPTGVSGVTIPHVHVSNAAWRDRSAPDLSAIHLSTGPIALSDIVLLLITEFGALPRRGDWAELLRENRDAPDAGT